jgi:hypothetical protein
VKRVAALVAAIAMVAGAWAVRDLLVDDAGTGANGSSGDEVPEQLRLTCATELASVCEQLASEGVRVALEDPGLTADRLAELPEGDDPGFDAWLADGPWAEMVADDREFGGQDGQVLAAPSAVLARSPAVIVVQDGRRAELEQACGGTITWQCVGEQAATLRIGLTAPDRGDGLVPLAEAAGSFFGTTDYSTVDFEEPGFRPWFDALTRLSRSSSVRLGNRSALAAAVSQAGTFNVVGALEAQAATLLRGRDGWETIYPEPMSTADVQLVPRAGLDAEEVLDRLDLAAVSEALFAQGWRTANGQLDPVVAIPDDPGLPSAGVLNALRDLW